MEGKTVKGKPTICLKWESTASPAKEATLLNFDFRTSPPNTDSTLTVTRGLKRETTVCTKIVALEQLIPRGWPSAKG